MIKLNRIKMFSVYMVLTEQVLFVERILIVTFNFMPHNRLNKMSFCGYDYRIKSGNMK